MEKIRTGRLSHHLLLWVILSTTVLGPSLSYAGSDTLNFDVKVTIVNRTCNLNDNQPINIDYGEVIIPQIKNNIYVEPIEYTLKCDGADTDPALKFSFTGQEATFSSGLLRTSEPNLAIQLKEDATTGSPKEFALNSSVNFQYSKLPNITATLVHSDVGGIDDGPFSASATFTVEYQ